MNKEKLLEKYLEYLKARKLSKSYYNMISIFFTYLEKKNLNYENITQETITQFFNENPDYSKNTLTQFIKAGRHFYTHFLSIPKEKNEWYKVKYIQHRRRIPDFLSLDDLKELIRCFCTYENRLMNPRKADTLITFMYMTGLRKEEILKLKREFINLTTDPCTIKIIGKGDKERYVFFSEKYSPGLKQKLIDYFNSEPEKNNCFNMTAGKLNYIVKKMNKYLNQKKISIHTFRHSFARYLLSQGVPLVYISKILGHSSINTTMIYVNPTDDVVRKFFKEN